MSHNRHTSRKQDLSFVTRSSPVTYNERHVISSFALRMQYEYTIWLGWEQFRKCSFFPWTIWGKRALFYILWQCVHKNALTSGYTPKVNKKWVIPASRRRSEHRLLMTVTDLDSMASERWNEDIAYAMTLLKLFMWPLGVWPLQVYNIYSLIRCVLATCCMVRIFWTRPE